MIVTVIVLSGAPVVVAASQLCAEPEAPSLQSKQRQMLDMMWTIGLEPGQECAHKHARTHTHTADPIK